MKNFFTCIALFSVLVGSGFAAEPPPIPTAADLASRLSTLQENGSTFVRLRLSVKGGNSIQLQIKSRRTKDSADVVYQVLWPKERKGEAVLLRKVGNRAATGSLFLLPNDLHPIEDLKGALFGSDLAYEDVIEDFFSWSQQAIVGTETIDRVTCQILESKPGKGERSMYGSVRSWIDVRRLVPLRVEKYSPSGELLRRIDTTQVVSDAGNHIPSTFIVRGPKGSSTELDGSRITHDVVYSNRDLTADGLKDLSPPRGSKD